MAHPKRQVVVLALLLMGAGMSDASAQQEKAKMAGPNMGTFQVGRPDEFVAKSGGTAADVAAAASHPCTAAADLLGQQIYYAPEYDIASLIINQNVSSAAAAFRPLCMSGLSGLPANLANAGAAQIVGILTVDEKPFCTAFRIGPQEIATARHCFHDKDSNIAVSERDPSSKTVIFHFGTPNKMARVRAITRSGFGAAVPAKIPNAGDYVILRHDATDAPLPKLTVEPPTPGEDVLVPGYFVFSADPQLENRIQFSTAPGCRISETAGKCLYYGCQTLPGFSGAPILRRAGDALVVVGVHVSSARRRAGCDMPRTEHLGNIGTTISMN